MTKITRQVVKPNKRGEPLLKKTSSTKGRKQGDRWRRHYCHEDKAPTRLEDKRPRCGGFSPLRPPLVALQPSLGFHLQGERRPTARLRSGALCQGASWSVGVVVSGRPGQWASWSAGLVVSGRCGQWASWSVGVHQVLRSRSANHWNLSMHLSSVLRLL